MNFDKRLPLILAMLVVFSLLLGACTTPAIDDAAEQAAPEQAQTEEPAAGPTGAAAEPTEQPSEAPTAVHTAEPAEEPAGSPTVQPTVAPVAEEALTANLAPFFASMDNYNAITPAELEAQIAAGPSPFLLDVRSAVEIMATSGYIPGAVIIPLQLLAYNGDRLPTVDTPIVVYGATDIQAAIGAVTLSALGYSDVKSMQGGGFRAWLEAGFDKAMFTGT